MATHMFHRMWMTAVVVLVGSALVLTACGDNDPGETGGDAGQLSGTITVWTWEQPAEALQSVVPAFEEEHPDITVDVQNVGNPAIWEKITTGMAAGGDGLADVLHIGIDYIGNYIEKFPDGLADLSQHGAAEYEDNFTDGVWKTAVRDDAIYGIPFTVSPGAFFYREDLFAAAGVPMDDIETWDQLIDAATQIHADTGIQLLSLDKAAAAADAANLWQSLTSLQGSFYFNEAGEITMNDEAGVTALTLIKEMNDAGLVLDVPGGSNEAVYGPMGDDQVLVASAKAWLAGLMPEELPDMAGKWRMRSYPAVEPGGTNSPHVGAGYLTVANSSPNADAAREFIEFALTDLENQQIIYDTGGLFPAFQPMYETEGFASESEYFGGQAPNEVFVEQLTQPTAAVNFTSDYARALKAYTDAQTQVLLEGADPKQALDEASDLLASQTGRDIAGG